MSSEINKYKKSHNTLNYIFTKAYDNLQSNDKKLLLKKCFDDLSTEDQSLFLNLHKDKVEKSELYYKIEACNDKLSIDIEHNNKKLKKCYDVCCFVPSSCCYLCSLFMKLFVSSLFILMVIFSIIMVKKIFI